MHHSETSVSHKQARRGPPLPLGDAVDYFSVSAATPPGATHPSGTILRIKLENPHPDAPFRSSQLINGRVLVHSSKALQIPNLSLRVYFESRTLYWNLEPKRQMDNFDQMVSLMTRSQLDTEDDLVSVTRHEVHRGIVPPSNVTLSWGARIDMTVTEWSKNPYAPRELCHVERSPPSTLRDSRFGSVQWVVEAIMDLVPDAKVKQDHDTMLRQPTNGQVVTRIAFPFVPSLEDVSLLRSEPFFGQDPGKDLYGSRRLSEEEAESGKKAVMERIREHGGKWEIYAKGFPTGKSNMWSEVCVPAGATIFTSSRTLPIILFLKHGGAQRSLKSLFGTVKPKPVYLRRAVVALLRVTSTRGGKEIKPHVNNVTVRQQEFLFDSQSSSSSTPGGLAILHGDAESAKVDLSLDLLPESQSGNRPSIPASLLTPSFRTPNIQHEFLLTVLLSFVGDETERNPVRFTVQILPAADEDGSQLPRFEEVVGGGVPPPAFSESAGNS
ncbi:hypothetical protein RSOLAG1IB_06892 [Rhizoctonia solani AG-1 IB]|uniref:Arrestin-like N-terminal domain-containing protein n=1 Tax=Thanatephorus cucumeris (strain AG1-IB / isolate 7/3/14) TaxID=1108050 RepID=A0A0B7FBC9_THACB|nr:hypothetical protein RSOLAG1IB_06892 [Rhizoctonia solani AG-1 IB]